MNERYIDPHDRKAIRTAPMFSALPPEALDALLAQSDLQLRPRRTTLSEQDEPATACYLVLDGWVKLFRMTVGGDEVVVGVFARGDCIAEVPCLTGGAYPVSGETVTDARLLLVRTSVVSSMMRERPEIAMAIVSSTFRHLHALVAQVEQLKAHTGAQRVAEFLLELCDAQKGACTITLPYDKSLIAGRLGMQPPSLSRAFNKLEEVGVKISQNQAEVADVARLRDYMLEDRSAPWRRSLARLAWGSTLSCSVGSSLLPGGTACRASARLGLRLVRSVTST